MNKIKESELVLNPDASVYHLKLKPEHIADTIIIVGDPARALVISEHFDKLEYKIQNREFVTYTGIFNNKRITSLATGIGTDNIDIVMNELDAVVNIDLEKRELKEKHTSLNIIRLGTSGSIQPDIPVDSFVMSYYGLGFDGLLNFYHDDKNIFETELTQAFIKHSNYSNKLSRPYIVKCSEKLKNKIGKNLTQGITATASGFYGPQGRVLRIPLEYPELNKKIETFKHKNLRITNIEMETSALYGLGTLLGHETLTVCDIIANRINKTFSKDYHKSVEKMIQLVLKRLTD